MAETIAQRTVLYSMPAVDEVQVRRDVPYSADLVMDVYSPPGAKQGTPAVVIVSGYPDAGFERMVGCKFKEMGSSTSWARLFAASGLAAITYTNREPESDLHALLRHVRTTTDQIGIWASSGNVPLALSLLMRDSTQRLERAALCYGYTLDVDKQAKQFRFANPCSGKTVDDLSPDIPFFLARAGRDETPRLNETLDRFVASAIERNLPVTFVNHPTGPHAFDLFDDSETTRRIVAQILAFMSRRMER